jgi:hypothetical protein
MKATSKLIIAILLFGGGVALIAWNMRDPDRAFQEPPREKRQISIEQVPKPVHATIVRAAAGARIEEIQEKHKGNEVKYEVEFVLGDQKTELEIGEDGSILERETKKVKHRKQK